MPCLSSWSAACFQLLCLALIPSPAHAHLCLCAWYSVIISCVGFGLTGKRKKRWIEGGPSYSACVMHVFSPPGCYRQGRYLHLQQMGVCEAFEKNGVRTVLLGYEFLHTCVAVVRSFFLWLWWCLRNLPLSHLSRRWLRFLLVVCSSVKCFNGIKAVASMSLLSVIVSGAVGCEQFNLEIHMCIVIW